MSKNCKYLWYCEILQKEQEGWSAIANWGLAKVDKLHQKLEENCLFAQI